MSNNKKISEHDEAWNKFIEIERLQVDIDNSAHIESRFTTAAKRKLEVKKNKLERYLTSPAASKANKWRKLIVKGYRKSSLRQQENFTTLVYDLMAEASKELDAPFPVEEQEVRRFLSDFLTDYLSR